MVTRRLFIDSRHASSGSSGNFIYPLPDQLVLPKTAVCYITDISLPHSWYTVDSSNRNLYIIESLGGTDTARQIQLSEQNYDVLTLRAEIESKLAAGKTVTGTFWG